MSTFQDVAVSCLKGKSFGMISRIANSKRINSRTMQIIHLIIMDRISLADIPSDEKGDVKKAIGEIYDELKSYIVVYKKSRTRTRKPQPKAIYGGGNFFDGRCRVPADRQAAIVANY